jgi:glycosyltransferase involved in cell wall biosynthesis
MNPARDRIAILGPAELSPLNRHLPGLAGDPGAPSGMGGTNIVHLVLARLAAGRPTDLITVDPAAREPIERHAGPLLRLWIVRRRTRRALRDGYRDEVRLLQQALRESGAGLAHANWTFEYGLAAVTQNRTPHLLTVHDHAGRVLRFMGWRYLPHYLISRRVLSRARHLTAVSPHIAAYVTSCTGRTAAVIPNLLSDLVLNRAPSATPGGAPLHVVSALTWAPYRNVPVALSAFALLRRERADATYTLLGPGFEPDGPAADWARSRGCADGVTFAGRRPYAEAIACVAGASVLLHPSLEESFGGPVAEAMALGVPVVATRQAGGPRWLLEDGRWGGLVDGADAAGMADAVRLAYAGGQDTAAARARILSLCDPTSVLTRYDEAYAEAAA